MSRIRTDPNVTDSKAVVAASVVPVAQHLVALRDELRSEIAIGHVLHGELFDVLARFAGADEVLAISDRWQVRAGPSDVAWT